MDKPFAFSLTVSGEWWGMDKPFANLQNSSMVSRVLSLTVSGEWWVESWGMDKPFANLQNTFLKTLGRPVVSSDVSSMVSSADCGAGNVFSSFLSTSGVISGLNDWVSRWFTQLALCVVSLTMASFLNTSGVMSGFNDFEYHADLHSLHCVLLTMTSFLNTSGWSVVSMTLSITVI